MIHAMRCGGVVRILCCLGHSQRACSFAAVVLNVSRVDELRSHLDAWVWLSCGKIAHRKTPDFRGTGFLLLRIVVGACIGSACAAGRLCTGPESEHPMSDVVDPCPRFVIRALRNARALSSLAWRSLHGMPHARVQPWGHA